MPLFEVILDFSYKISDVSYLDQNKVKVKVKVINVDAFRAAENCCIYVKEKREWLGNNKGKTCR